MERFQLRDVSIAEINSELHQSGVIRVDDHQRKTDMSTIDWSTPVENQLFSRELEKTFTREKLLGLLAFNTSIYDDETEDAIDEDPVVEEIARLKVKDRVNEDRYALAIRARRSIVAFMFEHGLAEPELELPKTSNSENNHPTAA